MRKTRVRFKKGIIVLCACVLAVGVCVGLVSANLAKRNMTAENYSFVGKQELGNLSTGSIVLGKNENGLAQEWHILGKDSSVSGENVVIVAANPIKENQVFQDEGKRNVSDSALWKDCTYVGGSNIAEVHPNHYGISDLRAQLKEMVTETAYFSKAEQALLNATTITTYDTRNRVNYQTTDKLYPLANVNGKLMAGSADDIEVQAAQTGFFWLRTPNGLMETKGTMLTANAKNKSTSVSVEFGKDVLPAANLNVSSVFFASVASSGQTRILDHDAAMILRMNGEGRTIGTVRYNNDTQKIVAMRDEAATDAVSLMVVGSGTIGGETSDWCYTAEVSDKVTVTTTAIKDELGITSEIDLEECKIWIESTDSTDNLTYATMAFTMMPGDYNGDGSITKSDTYLCKRYVLGDEMDVPEEVANANQSEDGLVTSCDIVWMMKNEQVEVQPNPDEGWGPIQ